MTTGTVTLVVCRNKRKTEGEYYYDYGDYGAAAAELPEADRVMGSQRCQPCRPKNGTASSKPGRPDPKLFRNGLLSCSLVSCTGVQVL